MKWISDLSIKRKILATIISTVALIAIFAVWAASSSISVQNAQTKMLKSGLIAQDLLLNADRDLYQAYTAVQSLVLADNSKEEIDKQIAFFNDNVKTAEERLLEAKKEMDATKSDWVEFRSAQSKLTAYELFEKVIPGMKEWARLSTLSIDKKAFDKDWEETFNQSRESLDEITELLKEAINVNEANYKRARTNSLVSIFSVLAVILGLIFAFGYSVVRNISKPLGSLVEMVEEFEKGHLKKRLNLNRKDEIGRLANTMDNYADYIQNYVVSSMDKISEGNFDFEFLIKDDKDEIGPALKKTAESIKGLVNEVNTLTSAAIEGKLQERGNKEKFKGLYRDIIFQESITRWMRQLSQYMKRLAYLKK